MRKVKGEEKEDGEEERIRLLFNSCRGLQLNMRMAESRADAYLPASEISDSIQI